MSLQRLGFRVCVINTLVYIDVTDTFDRNCSVDIKQQGVSCTDLKESLGSRLQSGRAHMPSSSSARFCLQLLCLLTPQVVTASATRGGFLRQSSGRQKILEAVLVSLTTHSTHFGPVILDSTGRLCQIDVLQLELASCAELRPEAIA